MKAVTSLRWAGAEHAGCRFDAALSLRCRSKSKFAPGCNKHNCSWCPRMQQCTNDCSRKVSILRVPTNLGSDETPDSTSCRVELLLECVARHQGRIPSITNSSQMLRCVLSDVVWVPA